MAKVLKLPMTVSAPEKSIVPCAWAAATKVRASSMGLTLRRLDFNAGSNCRIGARRWNRLFSGNYLLNLYFDRQSRPNSKPNRNSTAASRAVRVVDIEQNVGTRTGVQTENFLDRNVEILSSWLYASREAHLAR